MDKYTKEHKQSIAEYIVIPLIAALVSLATLNLVWTLFGY